MQRILIALLLGLLLLLSVGASAQVSPAPSLMNFQGRLARPDGTPVADGSYSVRFSLWSAVSGGTEKWSQTVNPVTVRNGVFAVLLSGFSAGVFSSNLWLEIKVGADSPLTPRQPLVTVAYAFKANTVPDGSIGATQLADSAVTSAKILNGTITGSDIANQGIASSNLQDGLITARHIANGAIVTQNLSDAAVTSAKIADGTIATADIANLAVTDAKISSVAWSKITGAPTDYFNVWSLLGNATTNPATHFLGTTDNQPLNIRVNNTRAMRYEAVGGTINILGGSPQNTIAAGILGATIAGGGDNGAPNSVTANYGTVGGGDSNTASGISSTVPGGFSNIAAGRDSFAAGNSAQANHNGAFVWADDQGGAFASQKAQQFLIRAGGGVGINTANTGDNALRVDGDTQIDGKGVNDALTVNGEVSVNGGITVFGFAMPWGSEGDVLTAHQGGIGYWSPLAPRVQQIVRETLIDWEQIWNRPRVWQLGGNSDTSPYDFLGTWDDQPLTIRVNSQRAMRYESVGGNINVLGGSEANTISGSGGTIAGGGTSATPNRIMADFGAIGGGSGNSASGYSAALAGGNSNASGGDYAFTGGGYFNTAGGNYAMVGGGASNNASGNYASVTGGRENTAAGQYSFAVGLRAKASHEGAFVWGDATESDFASTAANQFNVRASGGVRIFSKSDLTTGVTLAANDGAWNSVSDRNAKTNFQTVDIGAILDRLSAIPITTWNYKAATNGLRHIGPMAQDFYAAFGVGVDDKHISTIDADGVALAAIQGLYRKFQNLEAENTALKAHNREMEAKLSALAEAMTQLQAQRK